MRIVMEKKNRVYNMRSKLTAALIILTLVVTASCEEMIRDNLLILEEVAEFQFTIDTGESNYSETERVNFQDIVDDLDSDVEDVRFYNITLQVTNTYSTPVGTSISGTLRAKEAGSNQYQPLVSFSDITLEEFQTERSIFSDELSGISLNSNGIDFLKGLYDQQPAPTLDFNVRGTIARSGGGENVQFDFTARVYTQFETDP
jgi:hypothetical protein